MSDDYEVGYKKPPKEGRFKKGQSGNPKGRPQREDRGISDFVCSELRKTVTAHENGKRVRMCKGQGLALSVIAKAWKGDMRAFGKILDMESEMKRKRTTSPGNHLADAELMQRSLERYLRRATPEERQQILEVWKEEDAQSAPVSPQEGD